MPFDFKNASRDELKAQYQRIARETGDDQFFTKKELNHLPSVLADGEQVLSFSSGVMDGSTWLIVLTDRRVIFLDKGLIYGLKQASIDLDKINAVSGKTGLLLGSIIIEDGASSRAITNVQKRTVAAFTNKLRDAMENRKAARHQSVAPALHDLAGQLEKLDQLRQRGLLTDDEFAVQKAKLLA